MNEFVPLNSVGAPTHAYDMLTAPMSTCTRCVKPQYAAEMFR